MYNIKCKNRKGAVPKSKVRAKGDVAVAGLVGRMVEKVQVLDTILETSIPRIVSLIRKGLAGMVRYADSGMLVTAMPTTLIVQPRHKGLNNQKGTRRNMF